MTWLKSMVAGLVLANVVYFLWAHGIAVSRAPPVPAPPIDMLKLASESAASPAQPHGAALAGSGSAAAYPAAESTTATSAVPAPTTATSAVPAPTTAASTTAGPAAMAANVVVPTPGAGSVTHVAAPGAGGMVAGAAEARTSPAADVKSMSTAASGGPAVTAKRCISVGPFRDVSEAARAATTLRAGRYDPRQRVAEGDVWAGFWVYLPLSGVRGAGEQILARLKTAGIDDALEMPGPNEGSVVSLGLFSEPKRAQARVALARNLGFSPAVADRKRTGNVYWLDMDLKPTDPMVAPADLQSESGRIVRLEVKSCPSPPGSGTGQ